MVTRKETRLPRFAQACEHLAEQGWPVLVRESGGTAVPHGPGILHFSIAFAQPAQSTYDLDGVYQALCEPLRHALCGLGLRAEYGSVRGAYCDGRYNLVVDGLKITGTAQRLIASSVPGIKSGILAQAMLMVDSDPVAGTDLVNRFYRLAGDDRRYDPTASTSVSERLRHPATGGELTQEVRSGIRRGFSSLVNRPAAEPAGNASILQKPG